MLPFEELLQQVKESRVERRKLREHIAGLERRIKELEVPTTGLTEEQIEIVKKELG